MATTVMKSALSFFGGDRGVPGSKQNPVWGAFRNNGDVSETEAEEGEHRPANIPIKKKPADPPTPETHKKAKEKPKGNILADFGVDTDDEEGANLIVEKEPIAHPPVPLPASPVKKPQPAAPVASPGKQKKRKRDEEKEEEEEPKKKAKVEEEKPSPSKKHKHDEEELKKKAKVEEPKQEEEKPVVPLESKAEPKKKKAAPKGPPVPVSDAALRRIFYRSHPPIPEGVKDEDAVLLRLSTETDPETKQTIQQFVNQELRRFLTDRIRNCADLASYCRRLTIKQDDVVFLSGNKFYGIPSTLTFSNHGEDREVEVEEDPDYDPDKDDDTEAMDSGSESEPESEDEVAPKRKNA